MDYTKDAVLIHELAEEKMAKELREDEGESFTNSTMNEVMDAIIDLVNTGTLKNMTNATRDDGYVPYSDRWETYVVPAVFAIIFIIGVLGNGTLIVTFIRFRTMRNVPNMYICSLAVGDILVIFFCVPFTSTVYTVESWPYGLIVCKFSEFIKDVSIGVSVFTLTALSADRYLAIVDPMRKLPGRRATRITCITIAGIWAASLIIALPSVLFSYIREFPSDDGSRTFLICYPFPEDFGPTYPQFIVMAKFLVYYAIPLCFIATFYAIMARHLVLSTKNMPGEMQGQIRQIQGRKKVAKMVLSFVVIFAMCFFPNHLFFLWFYFYPEAENNFNEMWNVIRIVGFCLSFINSCINPITLYCVSGTFRKHFDKHLFCCLCKNRQPTYGKGAGMGSMSNNYSNHHVFHGNDRVQRNGVCRHQSSMSCGPKRNWIYENSIDTDATELLVTTTRFDAAGATTLTGENSATKPKFQPGKIPSSNNDALAESPPPSAIMLRGPAVRIHAPGDRIIEPEVTITSIIQNTDLQSKDGLD